MMEDISNNLTRLVIALSRACVPRCKILLTLTLVCIPLGVIASVEKPNASIETQSLQTKITQRDFKIIEQLVSIAQRNSAIVQETKAAIGLSAYQDILFVELSPNQTTTSFAAPDTSSESARSFSLTITIDPIKLVGTISQMPIREARWNEAKHQKRLTVMQYYFAYLQACQASKIAAYRMQKFVQNSRVANLNSQAVSPHQVNYLANSEYVAATTEMLNANIREQLTLEELAVCVGLSPQKMITIINGQ